MQFYWFFSTYPQCAKDEIHLLNNNSEAEKKLIKLKFFVSNEYKYKCARSLTELVFFATPKDEFFFRPVEDFLECCKTKYEQLCKKFGDEAIKNAFPTDKFDTKLIDQLRNKIKIYLDEIADEWERADLDEFYQSCDDIQIDVAEEELRRWDKEDPTWRIANDLD